MAEATQFPRLRFGIDAELPFDLPENVLVAHCELPTAAALPDPRAAMRLALDAPCEFPAISAAMVPGDKVTIALGRGVPAAAELVAGTVDYLLAQQIEASDITVLQTAASELDPRHLLASDVQQAITLQTHDPHDRKQWGYVALDEAGRPIYVNRALVEADVIVPIGCLAAPNTPGNWGVFSGLYPTYSEAATLDRFRSLATDNDQEQAIEQARDEVERLGWLVGAVFTVQVVPAADNGVLHILAGEPRAVARQGEALRSTAWSATVPRAADLVVAAVSGPSGTQNWESVCRALAAAAHVVSEDGAVALLTDLSEPPGPALLHLTHSDDQRAAARRVRKHRPEDALPAMQFADLLTRAKVFLYSQLPEDVVEDLGLAHVADPREIARLASRNDSCILIANAQYAEIKVADD